MRKRETSVLFAVALCVTGSLPNEILADSAGGRQERTAQLIKLSSAIPYWGRGEGDRRFYTFGQASKLCDWVVLGTVEEMKRVNREQDIPPFIDLPGYKVTLSADTRLLGKLAKKKLTLVIMGSDESFFNNIEQRDAKAGDRMLVFLTDKWYDPVNLIDPPPLNPAFFEFDKTKFTQTKLGIIYAWSHIILDGKETEEEAIRAAKGYLSFFGGDGRRDRDRYYEFLCSLLSSPVKRIRDDAESDLVLFYTKEKAPPPDLGRLLADGRVRKEVKDYLRYLLRDEKPKE